MTVVQQNMGATYLRGWHDADSRHSITRLKTVWEIFCVRAMETTGAGRSITRGRFSRTGRVAVPLADGYDLSCEGAN